MDVLFKHAKQLAPEVGRSTSHLGKWDRPMNVPRLFDEALTFVQISARSRCLGSFSNQLELKYTDRYRSTDSSEPLITPGKYCSQTCTESSFSSVVWPSMAHCLYPTRSFFTEQCQTDYIWSVLPIEQLVWTVTLWLKVLNCPLCWFHPISFQGHKTNILTDLTGGYMCRCFLLRLCHCRRNAPLV